MPATDVTLNTSTPPPLPFLPPFSSKLHHTPSSLFDGLGSELAETNVTLSTSADLTGPSIMLIKEVAQTCQCAGLELHHLIYQKLPSSPLAPSSSFPLGYIPSCRAGSIRYLRRFFSRTAIPTVLLHRRGDFFCSASDDPRRCYRNLGNIAVSGLGQIGKEKFGGSQIDVGPCFRQRQHERNASHDTGVGISIKAYACPRLVWYVWLFAAAA